MNTLLAVTLLFVGQAGGNQRVVNERVENFEEVPYKVDFSYLEQRYGLKFKNFQTVKGLPMHKLRFLVEFENDVDDALLGELRGIFMDSAERPSSSTRNNKLRIVWLDMENVVVASHSMNGMKIKGEVSGVKGDAFRVMIDGIQLPSVDNVTRAQIRSLDRAKTAEKKTDK